MAEKPEDGAQNGEVLFDREAYLRDEGFEDVEVVVSGRSAVRVDRKSVKFQSNSNFPGNDKIQNLGASGKAVLALPAKVGQGLPETQVGLDGRGLVRAHRVCLQLKPEAFADGALSVSGWKIIFRVPKFLSNFV